MADRYIKMKKPNIPLPPDAVPIIRKDIGDPKVFIAINACPENPIYQELMEKVARREIILEDEE